MSKTILNIRTEPEVKRQLQEFAAELGVPVSVVMNAQIKQMLRDHKIILSTELEPTPYLQKILVEVNKDLEAGKNISPVFESVDDMFKHLQKTS